MKQPDNPAAGPKNYPNGFSMDTAANSGIRLELTRLLYRGAPQALAGSTMGAIVLVLLLWSVADQAWLLAWLAGLMLVTALRGLLLIGFNRARPVASRPLP